MEGGRGDRKTSGRDGGKKRKEVWGGTEKCFVPVCIYPPLADACFLVVWLARW